MKDLIASLRSFLNPPQPASWQTLILLSLFSVFIAIFLSPIPQGLVSSFGWFFLITAVWWFVYEKNVKSALEFDGIFSKIFLGPWIVSILTCFAVFGSWVGFAKFGGITPPAMICIAPLAAAIAIAPDCVKTDDKTKKPVYILPDVKKRQGLVLFVLSHLLIACWVQFYFLIQGWLGMYPSLLADDLSRSAFVVRVQPQNLQQITRGREILNAAEVELRDRFANQSWGEIERWIFEVKADQRITDLKGAIEKRLVNQPGNGELNLWKLNAKVTGDTYDSGAFYNLALEATWTGPSSSGQNYKVTKTCKIDPKRTFTRRPNSPIPETKVVGKLSCGDVQQPKLKSPFTKV